MAGSDHPCFRFHGKILWEEESQLALLLQNLRREHLREVPSTSWSGDRVRNLAFMPRRALPLPVAWARDFSVSMASDALQYRAVSGPAHCHKFPGRETSLVPGTAQREGSRPPRPRVSSQNAGDSHFHQASHSQGSSVLSVFLINDSGTCSVLGWPSVLASLNQDL